MFLLRLIRRLIRFAILTVGVLLAIPVIGLVYGFVATGGVDLPPPAAANAEARAAYGDNARQFLRPEDNTFLTYPEWSIVYAARDYAKFLKDRRESDFPYFSYALAYWRDHARALKATSDYKFNVQYNTMLAVIGTSQTIEYVVQGVWENTVGRLTGFVAGGRVGEDEVRAALAHDYAQMLDQKPWYLFPYDQARHFTWRLPPAEGSGAVRSWERKLAFGLSDTIKIGYARLIRGAVAATGADETEIAVWASGPVAAAIAGEPDTVAFKDLGDKGAIFLTRRYQAFSELAPKLAARGVRFVEIGGNTRILATVLGPKAVELPGIALLYFSQVVPVEPAIVRTGLVVDVARLHEALPAISAAGGELEHLYDY
jgi:hypothetical protein